MNGNEKMVRYVTISTEEIHATTTEVYEDLLDGDQEKAFANLDKIIEIARDIKKSFTDEV